MELEFWEMLASFVGVATLIIGPTVWYSRTVSQKAEKNTSSMIRQSEESRDKLVQSVLDSQDGMIANFTELKDHFDKRLGEVYETVDKKSDQTRKVLMEELRGLRETILRVEAKSHNAQEHVHELEKQMLRIERDNHEKFIPKEQLDALVRIKSNRD